MKRLSQERAPRVLFSDDDAAARLILRETIEQADCEAIEAANGPQALQAFADSAPDLVILDVAMPLLDGHETCRRLRAMPGGQNVPILMLTVHNDLETILRAYDAGATDFATKPVNWVVLGQRIRYLLRMGQTVAALAESKARLAEAQRMAAVGNWGFDVADDATHWSDEIYRLLGYEPQSLAPSLQAFFDRVHPEDRVHVEGELDNSLQTGGRLDVTYRTLTPDGESRYLQSRADVKRDGAGKVVRLVGTIQDITDRRRAEDRMRFLAYYDSLTQLPNRQLFVEQLELLLASARRHSRNVAVLFLDVDRFKYINNTLGHRTGDTVIREIAARLQQCLRDTDRLTHGQPETANAELARLGGDEFTITISEFGRSEDAARVASRILDSLTVPIVAGNHEIIVTASIGISVFPGDGDSAETLLMNADSAMYYAKESGGAAYAFFRQSMNIDAAERLGLENRLRRALERNEFQLHYQPQFDIVTGQLTGAEALIRWQHPEIGTVPPDKFIPLAEETGLIVPIGQWVLREVCRQMTTWQAAGLPALRLAVNFSARQFRDRNLVDTLRTALAETRVNPALLEMEITESAIMHNPTETIALLNAVKEMGLHIAVDDFGTGYSSLGYLKRFPLDVLKIDRSFVREITSSREDAAIASAIIVLARQLGMGTVAEGVETEQQLGILRQYGCHRFQGYLSGKPLPAGDFAEQFLKTQSQRRPL